MGHEIDERRGLEHLLLSRYAAQPSPQLRDEIVERFAPLAHRIARRYASGHRDQTEDLVQVAMIGLIKAVDRFDATRGTTFVAFAVPTISGEVRRHLRDHTWAVRPPRDLQERALRLRRARDDLTMRLQRSPTVPELGEALGLDEAGTLEAVVASRSSAALSLESSRGGDDDAGDALEDRLAYDDDGFDSILESSNLRDLGRVLTKRERLIVRLRYVDDLTQTEIGRRIGVSQMHVSRLLRQALETMRAESERLEAPVTQRG